MKRIKPAGIPRVFISTAALEQVRGGMLDAAVTIELEKQGKLEKPPTSTVKSGSTAP